MNSSVYIFGSLSSGYTQYPDDNKRTLFKTVSDRIYSKDMIAVRRDGNLLYYIYARALYSQQSNSQYIGFAIELNGLYYNNLSLLFPLFEDAFTKVVLSGKFVEFNDDGEIVANTTQIHHDQGEVNRVSSSLLSSVEALSESGYKKLPPVNYSVGLNEGTHLTDKSSAEDVDNALLQYNAITIYKDSAGGISALAGYAEKIKSLSGQIKSLSKENTDLSDDLAKTKRQKKRTTIVTVLSLLIATAVVVIISVSTSLSGQVKNKESIIVEKNGKIESLERDVSKKDATISSLKRDIASKEALICKRDSFMLGFASLTPCPIAISDIEIKNEDQDYGATIYSSNTTYIYSRMSVHSLIDGTVDLYVKFYTPYGLSTGSSSTSGYSYTSTASLTKNQTTTIGVSGWGSSTKGHWKSGSYRIEYWYKGVCLGTKSFTIY